LLYTYFPVTAVIVYILSCYHNYFIHPVILLLQLFYALYSCHYGYFRHSFCNYGFLIHPFLLPKLFYAL
ncbi:unnamed protein product, partial [Candidula unifasciata]